MDHLNGDCAKRDEPVSVRGSLCEAAPKGAATLGWSPCLVVSGRGRQECYADSMADSDLVGVWAGVHGEGATFVGGVGVQVPVR